MTTNDDGWVSARDGIAAAVRRLQKGPDPEQERRDRLRVYDLVKKAVCDLELHLPAARSRGEDVGFLPDALEDLREALRLLP
jgi:hypothetical protein